MVTRKEKGRSRTKKINQRSIFILFALFSGSLIILALGLYLSNLNPQISPPAFEEIYAITSDLNRAIGKIENAIYESLYQGRIPEKNIIFLAVKPKHEQGHEWDFTELLVNLSSHNSALRLEKIINAELNPLKPQVGYKSKQVTRREIVYHIFALGLYTHKIRLIYGGYQETFHEGSPKIALIIDDLGYDRNMATSFFQLDLPLSFSVLPLAPYTEAIVREANKRGRELILHLPMEPKNYPSLNPGPGALLTDMDEMEIRRTLNDHLRRVSGSRGVNHHMGSYFTEKRDKMAVVLRELKKRNLFYIDSRTTSRTVALELAKEIGVPAARRHVFLDNDLSPKSIRFQMERLLGMARHSGVVIGIGHPHKETLQVLKHYMHRLKKDVKVVRVSELVS